ncbi:uncharacterized protein AC631_03504 [Debaryomyces fabryi]|uniref:Origin recognition complex subunit 1 n=1 Tax=Debaryomyces fabryi TaxID=58627 RepID=A0A0V1PWV4_9ASCO|nr:uncharacterized protein AC631_03504 [Debaryomyces fabryi]KSA00734.1 hypothetical protein AC631_03504 [Debaryomyces fabryi]
MRDIEDADLPKIEEYKERSNLNETELFITSYLDEVKLNEIITKVNILSEEEFKNDIVIDDSNKANTFVCRRGCDSAGELFTDVFDFRDLCVLFEKNHNEFIEFIRRKTVPVAYNTSKTHDKPKSIKEKLDEVETKKPKKKPVSKQIIEEDEVDNDSSDEFESALDLQDEPSSEELESDEEITESRNSSPTKRKTSVKQKETKEKRKRSKTPNSHSKFDDESRQFITSVVSPLNKRMKIKDSSKPSILALSPRKAKKGVSNDEYSKGGTLGVDASSEAFKEVKAKLHTSTRLSSLPCREDEFTSIYLNLETAIQEQTGCCLYVSGTPGVGKTATVREVIAQLRELTEMNELNDFDYLEINGLKLLSPNVAYEKLWEKISGLKVTASNAALLLESYFSQDTPRKPLIVLMDELDQIVTKKQNVMYNFFNWPTYSNSKLIVIAVANTMDLPERVLSNKISSRLGLRRIQFIGYTFEQLGSIIKHRLDMLTKQNKRKVIINSDAIGFASRKVASVSGDARRALTICRRAVEIAEKEFVSSKEDPRNEEEIENESYHVQISHISKAINETVNSPISQFLMTLPFASKLVLAGVLLRMKRSGLAENSLGDIIDEMKNSLTMLTSRDGDKALEAIDSKMTLIDLLYGNGLLQLPDSDFNLKDTNIRILRFKYVVNELVENGILQQNVRGERHSLINLNISEEEVVSVLKRDKEISSIL